MKGQATIPVQQLQWSPQKPKASQEKPCYRCEGETFINKETIETVHGRRCHILRMRTECKKIGDQTNQQNIYILEKNFNQCLPSLW